MQCKTSRREALKEMDHLFVDFLWLCRGSRCAVRLAVSQVKELQMDSAHWHCRALIKF